MTLKELFEKEAAYIIEIPISKKERLWIEGLDEFGCTINEEFNTDNIHYILLEHIVGNTYAETLDNIGITLDSTIEEAKERIYQ